MDANSLSGKKILLGVCGGIAAYKSCELVRRLRDRQAEVRVVMTRAAQAFVTPMTFQALSGHPVREEVFDASAEAAMGHIELARWADFLLVAPATAGTLARLAQGLADDLLATLYLASAAPVFLAPAMNQAMWRHPATQRNLDELVRRGDRLLGPAEGGQACGDVGPGRMLEPEAIIHALARDIEAASVDGLLAGASVMVTAGPTHEDIDPVRFVGNRSSGKMGYAVAAAAARAGARVTLISGPTALATPGGVECLRVRSARQMHEAVMERIAETQIFIAAAAVADYRVRSVADHKIKKKDATLRLELERNPDILAEVAARALPPYTVGFAAETERVVEHARHKLEGKGLDLIAANQVGEGRAFEQDDNALTVLWKGGQVEWPIAPKEELAVKLIHLIGERYRASTKVGDNGHRVSGGGG